MPSCVKQKSEVLALLKEPLLMKRMLLVFKETPIISNYFANARSPFLINLRNNSLKVSPAAALQSGNIILNGRRRSLPITVATAVNCRLCLAHTVIGMVRRCSKELLTTKCKNSPKQCKLCGDNSCTRAVLMMTLGPSFKLRTNGI